MSSWYIHTFIVATVAFSSNAVAKRHGPIAVSAVVPIAAVPAYVVSGVQIPALDSLKDSGDVEEEGVSYDLRIISLKPILGAARDAFDTILFTIANAGSDTSHVAKLLVGTKSKSLVTNAANANGSNAHIAARLVIPSIPPGGRVTLRVRVPKLQGDSTCYSGSIELPQEP